MKLVLQLALLSRIGLSRLRLQGKRQLILRGADLVVLIGTHDALHQMMTHYVALVEVYKGNAIHALEHIHDLQQAAAPGVGQIDLGDIAGDDALRVEPHAGDKHLHLFGGRVLRLVENDEGVIERAPAHESNGSNFNDVLFQIAVYLLRVEQIVERIVEGPQIRVNFFLQGARQKTKALAGFDRGAVKN